MRVQNTNAHACLTLTNTHEAMGQSVRDSRGQGFEGSYTIDADFITIHVKKKPVFVSKGKIETEIKKYLADQ